MFETKELRRGNVTLKVAKGHFATNHSHINYYIDITDQKIRLADAKAAAAELAKYYNNTKIDTILCMDSMALVGAFLADQLTGNARSVNDPNAICVLEPEYNTSGQMFFRDNVKHHIRNKNVLVLVASASTGYTAKRGISGTAYYGGKVVGIAGIYRAVDDVAGIPIQSIYSPADLPDYQSFDYNECPYCKAGRGLDAMVHTNGYTKL